MGTPTKFSHIREAEVANVSPFQQFLEKVGGMKSPIRGNEYFRDAKKDKTKSRAYDSGFDTLGRIASELSLPILSPPYQKLSKRPRLKSPVQCFSQSYSGSPPQTKNTETFSSQSPGKQELEEYYNMLCKTPGRESRQSPACSSQSLSDDIALKSQDYQIAEIKLSPFEKDKSLIEPHPSGCSNEGDQADELSDVMSQSSSFVIPPFMANTEGGMALQMLQTTARKMKEKQRHKTKEHVELISRDVATTAQRFFDTNQSKRKSVLEELTQNVHAEISDIESNLAELKKKEETALRNIALAHKTLREARIVLQNKMMLLKQKANLELPADDMKDLKEMKQTLFKKLQARQAQADKDLVVQQRQQLLKQLSLLVMSDFD